ncbi:MAG: 6-phosphofructokinase [Candidatus Aminicenantes bacterium]|nr:6-phosphofructokinase [Candidatus Aminicenantes bacterium]NIM78716.1 6-phosphofructokinase [Candidatus Aminicenantes bacterium]NIN17964.1 6-phosphofructokinase [Candidatus Aminicenantes bacterium]NIN41867.1 6-phosphofructokinase [Candidatus Aminicenantes bacterium]NIN84619.1 6-phosphofructokinase [Candidatus Aminicenantes bacterium]
MNGYKGNKKIGLVFSGGPAPSANAVISSVCLSFIDKKIPIIGFFYGFEFLEKFDSHDRYSLVENVHYEILDASIAGIRNRRGVYLKTSRANPGKQIKNKNDLEDPGKNQKLMKILQGLDSLGIGFLITIGGDDTLKTANYLSLMGLPVIHIPKTIDNDYYGISWTFGYWSAVQTCKEAILSLKADSESTNAYFLVELMGRKAGWITYASGIAGEAAIMLSAEDIEGKEMDIDKIADRIVDTIISREKRDKYYGIICVAESLADKLPEKLKPKEKDKHGNVIMGAAEVGRILRDEAKKKYLERTGRKKKIVYKQIGYETRTVPPISFDVVLGSMLGFGAYKLYSQNEFNCMVSVSDNFQVVAVPFEKLIDPKTLLTRLRDVPRGSDFFELKEALSFKHLD